MRFETCNGAVITNGLPNSNVINGKLVAKVGIVGYRLAKPDLKGGANLLVVGGQNRIDVNACNGLPLVGRVLTKIIDFNPGRCFVAPDPDFVQGVLAVIILIATSTPPLRVSIGLSVSLATGIHQAPLNAYRVWLALLRASQQPHWEP